MMQLVQHLKTGETRLEEVPIPLVGRGQVLIQTRCSLVSLGTERMLVDFGRAGFLKKVRQQPDKVNQVLAKIRTDGLIPTLRAVSRKLDQPLPLGYCQMGTVLALGDDVTDLRIGDRVISNGPHAEVVCVPRNLVAPVPDNVPDEDAVFTVVGSIGLHGIRLLNPTLNETFVVIGLGLIGLLAAQLLQINGCKAIGIEPDETKCRLAEKLGITVIRTGPNTDSVQSVLALTHPRGGADGVLITASTPSNTLIGQAARMSRSQGRIVLTGSVGLALNRADFQRKELSFMVSNSYGPGRYDAAYEQEGHDYPLAYVRWTENRNFQTILDFLATGKLLVEPLVTDRVPLAEYNRIYGDLTATHRIGALLTYPKSVNLSPLRQLTEYRYDPAKVTIGLIGAGNFTGAILLPALKMAGANLKTIASAGGVTATLLAKKYAITQSTTDHRQILDDPDIDLCIIATRHDSHARLTIEALQAGKHIFVEKPLAIHAHELDGLIRAQQQAGKLVMVGFNRRFSPVARKMKVLLGPLRLPMNVVVTINAGFIPADSWVHDRTIGGGRVLGETGHFVDFITFLTGSRVRSVCMNAMGPQLSETSDSVSLLLRYENGSTGVINYFSNGSKAYPKERVEVYSQERTLILDNFRRLRTYGFGPFSGHFGRQNKGHAEQIDQLLTQLRTGGDALILFAELINTAQTTLAALQSLRENRWVDVGRIGMEQADSLTPDGL